MNLQTILYGQFTPPLATNVRRHTILYDGKAAPKRYTPPPAKANDRQEYADKLYEIIKENPGICCVEASEKLKRHVSYVYVLRDILYDQGRIEGVRGKPIRRGGPKTTLFYVKG